MRVSPWNFTMKLHAMEINMTCAFPFDHQNHHEIPLLIDQWYLNSPKWIIPIQWIISPKITSTMINSQDFTIKLKPRGTSAFHSAQTSRTKRCGNMPAWRLQVTSRGPERQWVVSSSSSVSALWWCPCLWPDLRSEMNFPSKRWIRGYPKP